jgi:hypothetical protein
MGRRVIHTSALVILVAVLASFGGLALSQRSHLKSQDRRIARLQADVVAAQDLAQQASDSASLDRSTTGDTALEVTKLRSELRAWERQPVTTQVITPLQPTGPSQADLAALDQRLTTVERETASICSMLVRTGVTDQAGNTLAYLTGC